MNTPLYDTSAPVGVLDEPQPIIGLLVTNSADRRLLGDFLRGSGYAVRAGVPVEVTLEEWADTSLIITDEPAARRHESELVALKHQSGSFFLPVLIALPQTAASAPWLRAGFDDVLRMPLRKAELEARIRVYLNLRDQSLESRRLTRQVVQAQEAERQRLSRELHDEIGQALTAVSFNLQAYQQSVNDSNTVSQLQDSLGIIEATLHQVRDLSLDLHPSILNDLGLVEALQWYLGRQAERGSFMGTLVADQIKQDLSADLKSTCFRITQEALTNIMRHAHANKVRVELRQSETELDLRIRDDGVGFEVKTARQRAGRGASLGLLGMQERVLLLNGQLLVKSTPGSGTEIRARFPLTTVPLKPLGVPGKAKGV